MGINLVGGKNSERTQTEEADVNEEDCLRLREMSDLLLRLNEYRQSVSEHKM